MNDGLFQFFNAGTVIHVKSHYGRRGLVVTKGKDGFTFANPGRMRVAKEVAVEGGGRSGRWSVGPEKLGERAGSGLCSICNVWERVFHMVN